MEETTRRLPEALSQRSHIGHTEFLPEQAMTTCMNCCVSERLIRDLVPEVVAGSWSHRRPLPGRMPGSQKAGSRWA